MEDCLLVDILVNFKATWHALAVVVWLPYNSLDVALSRPLAFSPICPKSIPIQMKNRKLPAFPAAVQETVKALNPFFVDALIPIEDGHRSALKLGITNAKDAN